MKSLVQGTCEECTAGIVTISQMIGSEEVVVEIIDFLKVTKLKVLNIQLMIAGMKMYPSESQNKLKFLSFYLAISKFSLGPSF